MSSQADDASATAPTVLTRREGSAEYNDSSRSVSSYKDLVVNAEDPSLWFIVLVEFQYSMPLCLCRCRSPWWSIFFRFAEKNEEWATIWPWSSLWKVCILKTSLTHTGRAIDGNNVIICFFLRWAIALNKVIEQWAQINNKYLNKHSGNSLLSEPLPKCLTMQEVVTY